MDPIAAERAFRIQRPSLLRVIDGPLALADALYSKEVFSREVLDRVCTTVGLSRDEKNLHLLNAVEDKIMTDPSVFQTFVDALQQEGSLRTMATRLLESYRELKATPHHSTPSLTESPIARYARYLKDCYNMSPVSQDYKWPVTPSTRYVNLAIIKQERITRAEADEFTKATLHGNIDEIMQKKEPVLMEDVLKPNMWRSLRLVLVEGAPGVGKSTFSWELCRRWDDIEAMSKYTLVMHHSLRDEYFQKATRLDDLFFYPLSDLQQKVTKTVMAKSGEGTLIILDGADELPSNIRQNHRSPFNQILSGYWLPKATVLVTTRPTATAELLRSHKPDKRIEILGFTKSQINEYAESVLSDEEQTMFQQYVSSTPAISGLMYIPLNTTIIIEVYLTNKTKEKHIPTTLTQLFNEYSCILLERYMVSTGLSKDSEVSPQSIQDFPQQVRDRLTSLARLAYEGIVEQQVVFPKLPHGCTALGFTTTSVELYTGRKLSYQFLHLTLQEYLAALYISQLPAEEQKRTFQSHCDQKHLVVVWKFLAGLTGFKDVGWDAIHMHMRSDDQTWLANLISHSHQGKTIHNSPFILQCLYEAQEPATCSSVLGQADSLFKPLDLITPLDCFIVGYCISHSSCIWELDFSDKGLGPELVEMLAHGLKSASPTVGTIHSLILRGNLIDFDGIVSLKELPLEGLHGLSLINCSLHTSPLSSIFARAILPRSIDTLQTVDICDSTLTEVEILELVDAFLDSRNLHSLQLQLLPTDHPMGSLTPTPRCLQVHLRFGGFPGQIIVEKAISTRSSLRVLHLHSFDFCSNMDRIAALLENNSNLTCVSFHHCELGFTGAKCLADAVSKNTTLQEFCIYEPPPPSLPSVPTPTRKFGSIEPEGAIALSRALEGNDSLHELVLPEKYKLYYTMQQLLSTPSDHRIKFQDYSQP